jgi:membrane-associated phospholipid phosphatase
VSPLEAAEIAAARGVPVGDANGSADRNLPDPRDHQALVETAVGVVLVVVVAAVGVYFSFRPGATPVDRWLLRPVPDTHGGWFTAVTWLRYPVVTVVGAVVAAAVVFRRDRPRALACLIGPPLAVLTSELVAKPGVGRTLGGVYSYPSGSVVGAAALATVAILAAPARWRPLTTVVAVVFALWMSVAVVTLHWHYPTDALAGLAYGVGVVLVADGVAWTLAAQWPGSQERRTQRHRHRPRPGSDVTGPA